VRQLLTITVISLKYSEVQKGENGKLLVDPRLLEEVGDLGWVAYNGMAI
jgi:hypothetical protein